MADSNSMACLAAPSGTASTAATSAHFTPISMMESRQPLVLPRSSSIFAPRATLAWASSAMLNRPDEARVW